MSATTELKLVVVGGGGVGKSATVIQFVQGYFITEYDPTIEDAYRKQVEIDGEQVVLDILDTAGMEDYNAMREQYFRYAQCMLLVYSITSKPSFTECIRHYQQMLRVKEKDPGQFPTVLCGNKVDLVAARQVSIAEGQELADTMKAPFLETSAKTRVNVQEAFVTVVREARRLLRPELDKGAKQKKCVLL